MFHWTVHLEGKRRTLPQAAVAAGHQVYSFGGERMVSDRDRQMDVHILDTVTLRWRTLLPPSVTPGGGEYPLEVPSARCGHTAALIDDIVYVWGGWCAAGLCNALYAFDINTHAWIKTRISGTIVPQARQGHSACVLGKVMYIYGGSTYPRGHSNDIHKFDTATMAWSLIPPRSVPPPVSAHHSATIIGTKMFVFGGAGYNNDIRVFDTETDCWLPNRPAVGLRPQGRLRHSAFAYNGELYILCGSDKNKSFNDMWKYIPGSCSWKNVEPKGEGPGLGMSNVCCCMVGDRIILLGGWQAPNHLYILDLGPSFKVLCKLAVTEHSLEKSGLPHNIRWELAAMTQKGKGKTRRGVSNNAVESIWIFPAFSDLLSLSLTSMIICNLMLIISIFWSKRERFDLI